MMVPALIPLNIELVKKWVGASEKVEKNGRRFGK